MEQAEELTQPMTMPESMRTLLTRLIDYAGLFPPAALEMDAAVRNYAAYLASDDAWMLGRLIVPVARLSEFERAAQAALRQRAMDESGPWQITALSAPAGDAGFAADIERIDAFNRKHESDDGALAVIDMLEAKASGAEAIDAARQQIPDTVFPFFEISVESDPRGLIAAMAEGDCGAKVRAGGASAAAYPSCAALARFIHAAAAAHVPFKATAGLHHPLRHRVEPLGADAHGFLNVFVAACMAQSDELSEAGITHVLEERAIGAFDIDDDAIHWRNHRLRTASIEDVREEFAISFGSCSFDEPREDLRRMNLLAVGANG